MILKNKHFFKYTLVIIAMLSITQFFGLAKAEKSYPYMPRQINLSGNIINFAMPENFSREFPADDLVENYDLSKVKVDHPVELLRRWWDFSDNSFFKKDVGTMMMTIHIYENRDVSSDISNPLGFVHSLLTEMEKRDKDENTGRSDEEKVFFPSFYNSFFERIYSNQRWFSGGGSNEEYTQVAFHLWKQISEKYFIGVEFHFAPNNRIPMRQFIDEYCRNMLEKIMSTFDVIYSENNPIKAKLEANSHLKLDKLVEELGQKQLQ